MLTDPSLLWPQNPNRKQVAPEGKDTVANFIIGRTKDRATATPAPTTVSRRTLFIRIARLANEYLKHAFPGRGWSSLNFNRGFAAHP